MNWNDIVEKVTPYMVKIETPEGHGSGFLYMYSDSGDVCGIATAHHVIAHAEKWEESIRLSHFPSGGNVLLKQADRVIFGDEDTDSGVILIPAGTLELPKAVIPLRPSEDRLPI